jgi:hypothetical protein
MRLQPRDLAFNCSAIVTNVSFAVEAALADAEPADISVPPSGTRPIRRQLIFSSSPISGQHADVSAP